MINEWTSSKKVGFVKKLRFPKNVKFYKKIKKLGETTKIQNKKGKDIKLKILEKN